MAASTDTNDKTQPTAVATDGMLLPKLCVRPPMVLTPPQPMLNSKMSTLQKTIVDVFLAGHYPNMPLP